MCVQEDVDVGVEFVVAGCGGLVPGTCGVYWELDAWVGFVKLGPDVPADVVGLVAVAGCC